MDKVYKVKDLKLTNEIITAGLDGYNTFELNTEDLERLFSAFNLDIDNEIVKDFIASKSMQEMFDKANNETDTVIGPALKLYLKTFLNKMSVLKEKNETLYKNIVRCINENLTMSDDEAMKFEWPKLNENIIIG